MRPFVAVVAGAAAAALGALILGEYELRGATAFVAGLLFGVLIAEVILAVGRAATAWTAAVSALVSFGGLAWAGFISVRHRGTGFPAGAWAAATVGAAAAAAWVRSSARRGAGTRSGP